MFNPEKLAFPNNNSPSERLQSLAIKLILRKMKITIDRFILLQIVFMSYSLALAQAQVVKSKVDRQYFIENKGQWHSDVIFKTQIGGMNAWITKNGMSYEFYDSASENSTSTSLGMPDQSQLESYNVRGHRIAFNIIGGNSNVNAQGKQQQAGYYNFLLGNDPSGHASNVSLYKEVIVDEVYPGIDMRYYFDRGYLRYDFIVHPGADPTQILFSIEGADKTYIDNKGALSFNTALGIVSFSELLCYEKLTQREVDSQFIKKGNYWSINVGEYEKNKILVIDPLVYSTFIGGSAQDQGNSIALDALDNVYVTGHTYSPNYDITTGPFEANWAGNWDVVVSKLDSSGSALIYSTFIGGSSSDYGAGIVVDSELNAYIAGSTLSTNYDITPNAFQSTNGGNGDAFVSKLNSTGTALIYSTYIGGTDGDYARGIALDNFGNAYITGNTWSINYDCTPGALQPNNGGGSYDVFVTKLNATGTALIYSTYIGGDSNEVARSIAVDAAGCSFIAGDAGPNYLITAGAFQTVNAGGSDLFVTKLSPSGNEAIYSTYIGGNSVENGYDIAVDLLGNAYITGSSESLNFKLTSNAFQTVHQGGWSDAVLTKLNASGSKLLYSTYIGGNGDDVAHSIAIDDFGNACIVGRTESTDFDITPTAYQSDNAAGRDVFVSKFNTENGSLLYSTYIGGNNNDVGLSVALDAPDNVYITGLTWSSDYDTTLGGFQTTSAGSYDLFVTKLAMTILSVEQQHENVFFATPNPSTGIYEINIGNSIVTDGLIEIYDMLGKRLYQYPFSLINTLKLDISKEQAGIYLVKIKTENSENTLRVIKLD